MNDVSPMGLDIHLQGEALRLLTRRALWWPARQTLILADAHFGKAGVFRRQGVPLPSGGTAADLAELDRLLRQTGAARLLILGDFLHAAPTSEEPWLQTFSGWRATHRQLRITVVAGNHDRGLERLPADWALDWQLRPLVDGPFVFRHDPEPMADGYVLAGHLHPVLRLRGRVDRLRLPVFWFADHVGVLPSFGSFTGGQPIRPAAGDRVYGIAADQVLDCSAAAGSLARHGTAADRTDQRSVS